MKKIGAYEIGDTIGEGSFATVKKGRHIVSGNTVAIKIMRKSKIKLKRMSHRVKKEVSLMKLFNHPNIIRLFQIHETQRNIYIIMEYAKNGDFFSFFQKKGRLKENEARSYLQEIVSGVEYIHLHQIVHRDLKMENILMDNFMRLKIADFGLSNIMEDGALLHTSCGSPHYASPEVVSGAEYGPEVDVWAIGVLLYTMLCGSFPFPFTNLEVLFQRILACDFAPPCSDLSKEVCDLIYKLLERDPIKRIKIDEIFKNSWFNKDIPQYILDTHNHSIPSKIKIDDSIVTTLVQHMKIKREEITSAILNGTDEIIIAAYKIIENPELSKVDSTLHNLIQSAPNNINIKPHIVHHLKPDCRFSSSSSNSINVLWNLGVISKDSPHLIMKSVYDSLLLEGLEWKVRGDYSLICRGNGLKALISLYRFSNHRFVLDFMRKKGDTLLFFEFFLRIIEISGIKFTPLMSPPLKVNIKNRYEKRHSRSISNINPYELPKRKFFAEIESQIDSIPIKGTRNVSKSPMRVGEIRRRTRGLIPGDAINFGETTYFTPRIQRL